MNPLSLFQSIAEEKEMRRMKKSGKENRKERIHGIDRHV